MDEATKEEVKSIITKIIPEIDKRFTNKDEKRNLSQFLITIGFGTKQRFLARIIEQMSSEEFGEQMPSINTMETLMYSFFGKIKPKANMPMTPGMEAAGLKFFKVFIKLGFSEADIKGDELKDINNRFKLVLSSVAQNDGINPKDVLNYFDENNLSPEQILQYHKSEEQMKEELSIQSLRYNIKYELDKPKHLLNLNYSEIKALADAYNAKHNDIRIAGELIILKELKQIKIFTITDKTEFENEQYWSTNLMVEAKKFHNKGTWTYDRFCKIGEDVTSKFLTPIINEVKPQKIEQIVSNTSRTVHIHCNECHHHTNHTVSSEFNEREIVPEVVDGRTIEFWIDHYFQILKCGSCNEYTFKTWQIWSEDEPDAPPSNRRTYPKRGKPTIKKSDSFHNVPLHITGIYKEVYDTFINKNKLLCAGGIRAILEALCINNQIKEGTAPAEGTNPEKKTSSLKGRIYGLFEKGLITRSHADILVHNQYLGDKALHECEKPSSEELEIAIQIIAHTLSSVYELNQKGEELKNKKNSRIV